MVDIDGVISLFGFPAAALHTRRLAARARRPAPADPRSVDGSFHTIDGIPHFLSSTAAAHLLSLAYDFDLVWASGWEEKAEEYLPHLLGLPAGLPFLRFERESGGISGMGTGGVGTGGVGGTTSTHAHWKLAAIDAHAGPRPLAWIDDAFNPACHAWARARPAPTLLVQTAPERGLTSTEAELLVVWAEELRPAQAPRQ